MRISGLPAIALAAASVFSVAAPRAESTERFVFKLKDVEIYGSSGTVTAEAIKKKLGDKIERFLMQSRVTTKASKAKVDELRQGLEDAVREMGRFGWARLETVELEKDERNKYVLLLFDVIERKDLATRLPFRAPPTREVKDGSGLLEAYAGYDKMGWNLVNKNQLSVDRQDCPAFYCSFGSATAELAALERRFVAEVPGQKELLSKIARDDGNPERRSRALYLLTYVPDGAVVSDLVGQALFDPSDPVRQAAMSILTDMAVYHTEVPIPVHQVLQMLDFPYPEDRSRALALMLSIASSADYRSFMLYKAADRILELLKSKHPGIHSNAYTAITLLSGKSFGERDHDAWDRWLWQARREEADKLKSGEKSKFKFW